MTEQSYDQWKQERFGSERDLWHDGVPPGSLTSSSEDQRRALVAWLEKGVKQRDIFAIKALAAVDLYRAVEVLKAEREHLTGRPRTVAEAILKHVQSVGQEVLANKEAHDVYEYIHYEICREDV